MHGSYPTGYSKDQKRSFRRKAKLNFRVKSGVLYYSASSALADERRWRRVITTKEERHRVMTSCHASAEGKHLLERAVTRIGVGGGGLL